MEAEGLRLGWLRVVASVTEEGVVTFLDPATQRRKKGISLSAGATIENLLTWVARAAAPPRRR